MPSLKEKIEALIVGLDVSSTRFADLIGVKRPVISHILNGRNKPSLDIIQKIVERFPSLEYNWIGDDQDLDMDLVEEIRKNDLFILRENLMVRTNAQTTLKYSILRPNRKIKKSGESGVFL